MRRLIAVCLTLLCSLAFGVGPQALRGTIMGAGFRPDVVMVKSLGIATASNKGVIHDRARTYNITLQEGNDFMPEREIEIWFNVDVGKKLDGYQLVWQPVKFGTDEYRAQAYPPSNKRAMVGRGVSMVVLNDGSRHSTVSDRIDFRIAFGKLKAGRYPITFALALADGTRISGSAYAIWKPE